jgi:AhpD family alkylhydroperoxidase
MIRRPTPVRHAVAAIALALSATTLPALAADSVADATRAEIKAMMGGVPTFISKVPDAALPGFWALERDLELSDKTALDAKTKALISLAVASQIPCSYCIWADTNTLHQLGASEAEIAEAVSMAALTRYTSTTLNGLQVDFEQFKADLGGGQ